MRRSAADEWGHNLTMIGAMRHDGWLTLSTAWKAVNAERFVAWVRRTGPQACGTATLSSSTTLRAHKDRRIKALIARAWRPRALLAAYSHDFNPIEPG